MPRSVNHVQPASNFRADHPDLQTGFAAGYFYRNIEENVDAIGAKTGGALSPGQFAEWVGELLLSKARREVLGNPEYLSQVRGDAAAGHALRAAAAEVHVRPRRLPALNGRPELSAEARERIAVAQRERWRRAKSVSRRKGQSLVSVRVGKVSHGNGKYTHPSNWDRMTHRERQRWYYRQKQQVKADQHEVQKGYWAKFTPEERRAEMIRRRKVAQGKLASAKDKRKAGAPMKLPKGYWSGLVQKALAKGPMTQRALHQVLLRAQPEKNDAIFVTLATMKRNHDLVSLGEGMVGLPSKPNGAAAPQPAAAV